MKIRDDNYFQVSGWMITRLGLSGNRLLVYAIIYGFSQDGESEFNGGMDYLVQLTGASRRTVINTLNELTEAGLLIKRSAMKKGVEYSSYICTSEKIAPVQEMHQCENCTTTSANSALPTSAKIAPNNKNNNKKDNKGNHPFIPSTDELAFPAPGSRKAGTNPRALGINLRNTGNNPRASGTNPRKRKTSLSDDWFLPKDWGNWALEQGLTESEIRTEAECFADYWRSKGETRADWQATWRNWIRRRRTFERQPPQNGSKKSIYEQNREAGARAKKLIFGDAA